MEEIFTLWHLFGRKIADFNVKNLYICAGCAEQEFLKIIINFFLYKYS